MPPLTLIRLIGSAIAVLWARTDREVVDLLKDGQLVLVCSLGDAVEEAKGAVARLWRESKRADLPTVRHRSKKSTSVR